MTKTVRYILYAVILAICIMAIFVGVYSIVFKDYQNTDITNETDNTTTNNNEEVSQEAIKAEFQNLFVNTLEKSNFDESSIVKKDASKEIVYNGLQYSDTKENLYEMNLNIPFINIDSDFANSCNQQTQQTFVNEANKLLQQTTTTGYTIFNVNYAAFINNNILSIGIMATLKEGNNAQRTLIKTYNYNLTTNTEVTINDIINNRGLDTTVVNKQIHSVITAAQSNSEALSSSGYNVYTRDLQSDIYNVTNVQTFMQGPNGELYIIYDYGNTENTSEMDIIKI